MNGTDGDAFPEDPNEWADSDGDDVGDNSDPDPNDPNNPNPPEVTEEEAGGSVIPGFGFMAALGTLLLVAVFRSERY